MKMKKKSEGGGGQGGCELHYCDNAKKCGGGGMRSLLQNMSEKIKIFKR